MDLHGNLCRPTAKISVALGPHPGSLGPQALPRRPRIHRSRSALGGRSPRAGAPRVRGHAAHDLRFAAAGSPGTPSLASRLPPRPRGPVRNGTPLVRVETTVGYPTPLLLPRCGRASRSRSSRRRGTLLDRRDLCGRPGTSLARRTTHTGPRTSRTTSGSGAPRRARAHLGPSCCNPSDWTRPFREQCSVRIRFISIA